MTPSHAAVVRPGSMKPDRSRLLEHLPAEQVRRRAAP